MALTTRQRAKKMRKIAKYNKRLRALHSALRRTQKEIAKHQRERRMALAELAADPQTEAPPNASRDLIPWIHTQNPPPTVISQETSIIPTGHTKIPTHLQFLPTNTERFVTSGHDGMIKVWQLDPFRTSATNKFTIHALRGGLYPEDISVSPFGESLVAVYGKTEEIGLSQIVMVKLKDGIVEGGQRVRAVAAKAHERGVLRVEYMPWKIHGQQILVTSGDDSDHRLVSWKMGHQWTINKFHKEHTSTIGGFCGLYGSHTVVSVGRDRKLVSFDAENGGFVSETWKLNASGLSVVANPLDYNLVCAQTNVHRQQLRLVDLRVSKPVHDLGWSQEKTSQQSSYVSTEWSPNGWLLSSGSSEKFVHVFDIRFNKADNPTDTFLVHSKRVCKAAWHPFRDTLLSISSDHTIGFLNLAGDRLSCV